MTYDNQFFSAEGYKAELRSTFFINRRMLVAAAAAIFIVIFLVEIIVEYSDLSQNIEWWRKQAADPSALRFRPYDTPESILDWITTLYFATICIASSAIFNRLSRRDTRVVYLTTPTSAAEKLAAQLTVYILGATAVFAVSFVIIDNLRPLIFTVFTMGHVTHFESVFFYHSSYMADFATFIKSTFAEWLYLASLFIVGAIVFEKGALIKTFSVILLMALALVAWGALLAQATGGTGNLSRWVQYLYHHPALNITIFSCLTMLNIVITYMRLKETDVISKK